MRAVARPVVELLHGNGGHPRVGGCHGDRPHHDAAPGGGVAGAVDAHAHQEHGRQEAVERHDGEEHDAGVVVDDVEHCDVIIILLSVYMYIYLVTYIYLRGS